LPAGSRLKKNLIHAFVLFHLTAVAAWSFTSSDSTSKLHKVVRSRFAFYMLPTGLWQAWNMFAPNPAISNVYLEAEVTLADGSRVTWKFPRMNELGYFDRYRRERYRKWASERVWTSGQVDRLVAEPAARFAARQVERPDNQARVVELVRYRAQIRSPKRDEIARHDEVPQEWERLVFFTYQLDAEGRAGAFTMPAATQPQEEPAAPAGGQR
jgi:hypothetical protein